MTPDTFFDNFALLTDAPNAVAKLREMVLGIAYSGKLTERWRNEHLEIESSKVLLTRICKERQKWIDLEKSKGNSEAKVIENKITKHSVQYPDKSSLPRTWEWASLMEVCLVVVDCHNKTAPYVLKGIPLIRTSDIKNGRLSLEKVRFVTQETYDFWSRRCPPKAGDILFTREAPMGEAAIIPDATKICMGQRMMLLRPVHHLLLKEYLLNALREPLFAERMTKSAVGMTVKHLRVGDVESLVIPLPPLAEQKRIVEKCDRLLILCAEIEKRQQQRQASLLKMNEGAMSQLLAAQNPDDFYHHWQGICNNFDLLYSIPETIPKLRQAILQLAIQGKLVPQDPNDEPVSVSLSRIKIKKNRNKQQPVDLDTATYEISKTWQWVRLGEVAEHCLGKMLDKQKNKGNPLPYLRNLNVRWLDFNLKDILEMPFEDRELERFEVKSGDVLICEGGEPGRAAVWNGQAPNMKFQKALHRVRPSEALYNHFLVYCLLLDSMSGRLEQYFTGATFKHFTGQELAQYLLPLPPLAEQKRIVAKVDSLLSLCDALEAKLKAARHSSTTLMEVAARQVLAV